MILVRGIRHRNSIVLREQAFEKRRERNHPYFWTLKLGANPVVWCHVFADFFILESQAVI